MTRDTTDKNKLYVRHRRAIAVICVVVLLALSQTAIVIASHNDGITSEPDLTTWDITDSSDSIDVSTTSITVNSLNQDDDASVSSTEAVPLEGDGVIEYSVNITDASSIGAGSAIQWADGRTGWQTESGSNFGTYIRKNGSLDALQIVLTSNDGTEVVETINQDSTYYVSVETDRDNRTITTSVYSDSAHTNELATESGSLPADALLETVVAFGDVNTDDNEEVSGTWQNYRVYGEGLITGGEISGRIETADSNEDLNNVTVTATNSTGHTESTTTNLQGKYSLTLENGEWEIQTSKDGYFSKTENVTIDNDDHELNFELQKREDGLEIRTHNFLEHDEVANYRVYLRLNNGTDGGTNRYNVSSAANVTSGNTSVVTVDETALIITGTNDTSVNVQTYIKANYTMSDGTELETYENVTVANLTVTNLQILPPVERFVASLDGGTDSNRADRTLVVILLATAVAVAASRIATSFAGLGAQTGIMLFGWIMGIVSDGVIIVAVFTALFIGLNVAGNVKYPAGLKQ